VEFAGYVAILVFVCTGRVLALLSYLHSIPSGCLREEVGQGGGART